jgi:hypothetical protein
MAAMKAKEKEMKDEKEAERQVITRLQGHIPFYNSRLTKSQKYRGVHRLLKINEKLKQRKNDMRN